MTRIACSAIGALLLLTLAGDSWAGHCKQFFVQKQVKAVVVEKQVVAPVYAVNVPVYYGVGAHLQYEALQQKAAIQAEFEEFQRWRLNQQATQSHTTDHVDPARKMINSVVGQKCAKCHGRQLDDPKGDLYLDAGVDIAPEHVVAALKQIRDDTMPPEKPLTAEEKAALMQELLGE